MRLWPRRCQARLPFGALRSTYVDPNVYIPITYIRATHTYIYIYVHASISVVHIYREISIYFSQARVYVFTSANAHIRAARTTWRGIPNVYPPRPVRFQPASREVYNVGVCTGRQPWRGMLYTRCRGRGALPRGYIRTDHTTVGRSPRT